MPPMESVGKGKWIQADPMAPKVAVGEACRDTNLWFDPAGVNSLPHDSVTLTGAYGRAVGETVTWDSR